MQITIYCILAFALTTGCIVPVSSQTVTEKKTQTNVKRESNREKGLVKIYSTSRERESDVDIDEEALEAIIEASVEKAMKSVEVVMQKLEISMEKMEINLKELEVDVEPIHIKIPELESLKDLDIKLEHLNQLNDLDIEHDWDEADDEGDAPHHHDGYSFAKDYYER